MNDFLKKLGLFGLSATLFFSLPSCSGEREEGVTEEVDYDQEAVVEEEVEIETVSNEGYYDSWDLDDDNLINETEWEEGMSLYLSDDVYDADLFNEWDQDDDSYLDEDEFSAGNYSHYDIDVNAGWDEVEFNAFTTTHYYDTWDRDNNNEIGVAEFEEGWSSYMPGSEYDAGLFDEWDLDDNDILDDDEFAAGMYDYWDIDDSGYVEETEYSTYYTY